MDQDRTLRTFRFGFESRAGYQVCEVVAERQRHLTVYEDYVGSTPIHFAKVFRFQDSATRIRSAGNRSSMSPALVFGKPSWAASASSSGRHSAGIVNTVG